MPQPKRVRDIEYGRIDRVEDGAQPGAHIPLVKARSLRTPVKKTHKEQTMPKPKTLDDLDLSKLDDDAKALIESAFTDAETAATERDAAKAEAEMLAAEKKTFDEAVAALAITDPAEGDDEMDVTTVEGIEKAIKKTRSPEMKAVLTAAKVALKKANEQTEEIVTLRKAERSRVYIAKAKTVPNLAVHAKIEKSAGVDEVDGITALSGLLDTIGAKCGDETVDAVVAMLSKAQTQLREAVGPLLKSVGVSGGEDDGQAEILDTGSDDAVKADAELTEIATELRKANKDLTPAQARRQAMQENTDIRKRAAKKSA